MPGIRGEEEGSNSTLYDSVMMDLRITYTSTNGELWTQSNDVSKGSWVVTNLSLAIIINNGGRLPMWASSKYLKNLCTFGFAVNQKLKEKNIF